jgi:hypothetical protein
MGPSRISNALTSARLQSAETTSDWTILPTTVCLVTGAIVALVAAAVSGPPDALSLAVMVAFP